MQKKNPYEIIKSRYITEKSRVMETLKTNESNVSVRRCQSPKYVFLVNPKANKQEIARAVEEIYAEKNIKVTSVNTINAKPKVKIVRGRLGEKSGFKKAIVTLAVGDSIDEQI